MTTIYGKPVGKPRMTRADKWKQRPCVLRYRTWCDLARLAVFGKPYGKKRLTAATSLRVVVCFPASKRHPEGPHTQRPDGDNVLKSVCDALFENDEMVYSKTVEKYWTNGPQRVEVEWS